MPTAFATIERFCTTCVADTAFEQPGCPDGHGADCPEWACIACGEAVLVGFVRPQPLPARRVSRHVA